MARRNLVAGIRELYATKTDSKTLSILTTKDKRYSDDYYLVNQILAEWNPIGVPEGIADSEYTMYVPNMLKYRDDYDGLVTEMKRIVNDVIGLTFDNYEDEYKQETLQFAKKIIETLRNNELISNPELSDAIETDTSDNKVKANAELLLNAITDYPSFNIKEPIDFLNELKNHIGSPLTFELIDNYEKKLTFNNGDDTWRKEALSSVLEMFYWDKTKTLDELIIEISKHYKLKQSDNK